MVGGGCGVGGAHENTCMFIANHVILKITFDLRFIYRYPSHVYDMLDEKDAEGEARYKNKH